MKLIVIIPAYNEEKTITSVIKSVPRQIINIDEVKVYLINDGSTDKTIEVAKNAGVDKIINNPVNLGFSTHKYLFTLDTSVIGTNSLSSFAYSISIYSFTIHSKSFFNICLNIPIPCSIWTT